MLKKIYIDCDLCVVGGGMAGLTTAISAAREGAKTLLIEKSGALGGAMNVNLVYPFMRYYTFDQNKNRVDLSAGIFSEMVDNFTKYHTKEILSKKLPAGELFCLYFWKKIVYTPLTFKRIRV